MEFIKISAAPEAYYASISREQAQSFDADTTLECVTAPRILLREGQTGTLACSNPDTAKGLGIGLHAEVSSDGRHVRTTLSLHDGLNGFEIPDVSTEPGGAILVRTKGMFPGEDGGPSEFLIHVQIEVQ